MKGTLADGVCLGRLGRMCRCRNNEIRSKGAEAINDQQELSSMLCYACCMQITLTVPDEAVAGIRSRGTTVEAYLQRVVDETLQEQERLRAERHREAVDAMLRFGEEHHLSLGGDDLKSMVHEGHKY